jgi:hypothetical protein
MAKFHSYSVLICLLNFSHSFHCGLKIMAFDLLLHSVLRISYHCFAIIMFCMVHAVVLVYYLSAIMCASFFTHS